MVAVLLIDAKLVLAADMHRNHVRHAFLIHHNDEVVEQHVTNGQLGHKQGLARVQGNLHAHGHAAAQHVVRVRNGALHIHQTGGGKHAVHGHQGALVRQGRAILHEQLELRGCRSIRAVGADVAVLAEDVDKVISVDGEVYTDGVDGGDVGQLAGRAHQVADGNIGCAYDAVIRCADDGVVQVNLGFLHGGFLLANLGSGCFYLGVGGLQGLLGIGQILLRNGAGCDQLGVSLHVQLGLGRGGFCCGQGCPGSLQVGLAALQLSLEEFRVNAEEYITGLDTRAVLVLLGDEESGDTGMDIRILLTFQVAEPFSVVGYFLVTQIEDLDGWSIFLCRCVVIGLGITGRKHTERAAAQGKCKYCVARHGLD